MYGPAADGNSSRESYAAELANRMEAAHEKLRTQQLLLRTEDRQEEPSFKAGQLVWLKTKRFSRGQSHRAERPSEQRGGEQIESLPPRGKSGGKNPYSGEIPSTIGEEGTGKTESTSKKPRRDLVKTAK